MKHVNVTLNDPEADALQRLLDHERVRRRDRTLTSVRLLRGMILEAAPPANAVALTVPTQLPTEAAPSSNSDALKKYLYDAPGDFQVEILIPAREYLRAQQIFGEGFAEDMRPTEEIAAYHTIKNNLQTKKYLLESLSKF